MNIILGFLQSVWTTFLDMAPYLLLGLTFAGLLHVLVSKEMISRHLGASSFGSVLKAAILGVPLPLCSCGVVPTALSLRRSKASQGATVSFLISTPQTGVDSIIATYGLLGPVFAVFRPLAALLMGVVGGIAANLTGVSKQAEPSGAKGFGGNTCAVERPIPASISGKVKSLIRYAYGEFLDDISVQLVVGIIISGAITFFLPVDFFTRYIGNNLLEMLIMIVGGIPLYVCATASIPIAGALMLKGLSPGAAFVFLAVGPATNAATITLVGNVLGKRILAVYLAVISIGAVLSGLVLNMLYAATDFSHALHFHEHDAFNYTTFAFSLVFLILLLLSLIRKWMPGVWRVFTAPFRRTSVIETAGDETVIRVEGMTCNHCAGNVREAIDGVEGVREVTVDLTGKSARIKGDFNVAEVVNAIESAGYKTHPG